jgi:hypothetical protein
MRFFEKMDRRHHGYVTDKEIGNGFPAVRKDQPIDPHFRMSLTEFEDFMLNRFDKADVEHNGVLPPGRIQSPAKHTAIAAHRLGSAVPLTSSQPVQGTPAPNLKVKPELR